LKTDCTVLALNNMVLLTVKCIWLKHSLHHLSK